MPHLHASALSLTLSSALHHGSEKHVDYMFCCSATLHSKLSTFSFSFRHCNQLVSLPVGLLLSECPATLSTDTHQKEKHMQTKFRAFGASILSKSIHSQPLYSIFLGFPTCWLASVRFPIAALSANFRHRQMLPLTTTTIPDQVCSCPPAGDVNYVLATGSEVENNQPPSCLKKGCSNLYRETEESPCGQPPAPFFQARQLKRKISKQGS